MRITSAGFIMALCAGVSWAGPIVDFTFVPPGSPAIVQAGGNGYVVFSVFNSTADTQFLYQAGLTVACLTPPCGSLPPPTFNPSVGNSLGPTETGLLPGQLFTDVLWTQLFTDPTPPGNPWLVIPRVNFTGYTEVGNILGPTFVVVVVPEPRLLPLAGLACVIMIALSWKGARKPILTGRSCR